MLAAKSVTVIPATKNIFKITKDEKTVKRRVAAYARVSTGSEEQLTSYEAQVDYYTKYIKSKNDWEFVKVYTDEGITATNTKRRDGFNQMIQDALNGKIDLIVTKSVSRFARNTVDSLIAVRKLKAKGREVYFEKENIYTLDSKGELLITIMSSLAQEESRSISENVTWGQRKRFADGKVSLPYKHFLGYEKGPDGLPKVVEKEAETIRLIYRLFLEGKTLSAIAQRLTHEKIKTPSGKEKWNWSTVKSILSNEKYKGDALLQKCYTIDFLTKKQKKNEGEVPQYYVKNSHEAIISTEVYDLVQAEFKRRTKTPHCFSSHSPFSSKIECGECGGFYGSKVWHSTSKYRKVIWRCNNKYNAEKKCKTPHLYEKDIKEEFVKAFNDLINNKEEIIRECQDVILNLTNTEGIDREILKLKEESSVIVELMKSLIDENARKPIKQEEHNQKYSFYAERYEETKNKLLKAEDKKQNLISRRNKIQMFINNLREQNRIISEFDENLWYSLVEKAVVNIDGNIRFIFKNKQ